MASAWTESGIDWGNLQNYSPRDIVRELYIATSERDFYLIGSHLLPHILKVVVILIMPKAVTEVVLSTLKAVLIMNTLIMVEIQIFYRTITYRLCLMAVDTLH